MTNTINPITKARRRFLVEAILSLIALVTLATCQSLTWNGASERWKLTIVVLGMIPIVFVFAAMARHTLRTDELNRKKTVESLAMAGGMTVLIALMYGLLETIGFPRPQANWTAYTFICSNAIATFFVHRRYK